MKVQNTVSKLCFYLVFCLSSVNGLLAQGNLKILQYNIFEGFKGDSVKQNQYVGWLKEINPDIIAYQEMNGFTQKRLENFALKYGHEYAVLLKTEGYPVALTSKFPIVNVQKVIDNMQHGYIYAKTANLHIFVIHFSPHQLTKRQSEMRQVLAHAALLPQNEKIVITGDFNSFSPSDSIAYDGEKLKSYLKYEKEHSYVHNLCNGHFDYSVIEAIEKAGFTDLLKQFHTNFIQSSVENTQRIDYMFANKELTQYCLSNDIIINNKTQKLSDHYPTLGIFTGNK